MRPTHNDVDIVFLEMLDGAKWFAIAGLVGLIGSFLV